MGRPHGKEGAFVVAEPTERLELLDPGRSVRVAGRTVDVAWRKGTPERPVLKLESDWGREAVRGLHGEPITVPRSAIVLAADEFLVDDLVGCEVLDGDRRIGRVRDVLLLPSAEVLEVERTERDPLLVPFVRDAVRSVDLDARRVEIDIAFVEQDHAD